MLHILVRENSSFTHLYRSIWSTSIGSTWKMSTECQREENRRRQARRLLILNAAAEDRFFRVFGGLRRQQQHQSFEDVVRRLPARHGAIKMWRGNYQLHSKTKFSKLMKRLGDMKDLFNFCLFISVLLVSSVLFFFVF